MKGSSDRKKNPFAIDPYPSTTDRLPFLAKEKRQVQACDGGRGELNREQQPTDDGIRLRRGENEMKSEKGSRLRGRRFPWGHHERDDQDRDHAIKNVQIQLFSGGVGSGGRAGSVGTPRNTCTALGAVAVDFR